MNRRIDRRQLLAGLAMSPWLPMVTAATPGLRVASLDWALAETMLALGHEPIAIVAASDWHRFVVEPPLPEGVVDIGLQQEINLELLASLAPDLILTSPFIANLDDALRRIATTEQLSIFEPTPVPLGQPRRLAELLGERLERRDEARQFLDAAEQTLDGYRARIAALRPPPVMLASLIDPRHVRVYGGNGLFNNVLERLGVRNAWTGATSYWGFATLGIERLATSADLRLLLIEPVPADARATLARSPLWSQLPFVAAGHVSELPPVLMFGAMPSALRFARLLVEHLESVAA